MIGKYIKIDTSVSWEVCITNSKWHDVLSCSFTNLASEFTSVGFFRVSTNNPATDPAGSLLQWLQLIVKLVLLLWLLNKNVPREWGFQCSYEFRLLFMFFKIYLQALSVLLCFNFRDGFFVEMDDLRQGRLPTQQHRFVPYHRRRLPPTYQTTTTTHATIFQEPALIHTTTQQSSVCTHLYFDLL